jgi:hypothetical protein
MALLQQGLAISMQWLFWGVLLVSMLTCVIAWRMRDWKAAAAPAKP